MVHDDDKLSERTQFPSTHWPEYNEIDDPGLRIFFISILAHVILTWLSPNSFTPATRFIGELVAPVLRPIKARLPYLAGLDFSPLIAVVIIQSIIMIIPINTVFSGILCLNFRQIL